MEPPPERRLPGWAYPVLRVLYWLAVFAVSLALVIAAVLYLETRDPGSVEGGGSGPAGGSERPGR